MKVLTVVGARPQFVKAAAVSRVLRAQPGVTEILVHTGQHFDANMSDIFFDQMGIPRPDHHLGVAGGGHGQMTGRMLEALESLMLKESPDWVLVYGDTNSTLAGALAAVKLHIPVAHVEAGLRSHNMHMPEEINRVMTDRVSHVLFCPTELAIQNLRKEGFDTLDAEILNVGDVMLDAALYYRSRAQFPENLSAKIDLDAPFILCTVHRAENTDDPERLRGIIEGLDRVHKDIPIVLSLHPRTKQKLKDFGLEPNVHLIEPVGYFEMIWLLEHCRLVITDSGGLQKEAWFFDKACVTLREETEWMELVKVGGNRLVAADASAIYLAVKEAMKSNVDFSINLYGGGEAANRIVERLVGN